MDRVTFRMRDDCITVAGAATFYNPQRSKNRAMTRAIAKLAAYEDTDLEPSEIVRIKKERDAAVKDLEDLIFQLRGSSYCDRDSKCGTKVCYVRGNGNSCRPKWRGPQEAEE